MSNQAEYKEFIFNDKIDKESLTALYETDYRYMEEIFSITLTQLKPDIIQLFSAFQAGNLADLKKTAHRIKPSFGFVGMYATQQSCKAFEDCCDRAGTTQELAAQFHQLHKEITEAAVIIEEDYRKLKEFNKS